MRYFLKFILKIEEKIRTLFPLGIVTVHGYIVEVNVVFSALEEQCRLQFDGGTRSMGHSRSSPVLHTYKSRPLTQYLQKNLPEFGFADLGLKMDSDAGTSESSWGSSSDTASQADCSSSDGSKVTFHLGLDDSEDFSDTKNKFWYDEDSLTVGQSDDGDYFNSMSLQQKSVSMMELQNLSSSRRLSVF